MAEEQLIGYSLALSRRIERAVVKSESTVREPIGVAAKSRRTGFDSARVMCIDATYPIYTPRERRPCAYFLRELNGEIVTVEMFGDDLFGAIDVTVGDAVVRVDCQADTDTMREAFGFNPSVCRVTALPGLWEFAFADEAPFVAAEAAPGYSPIYFSGGLLTRRDQVWKSQQSDGGDLSTLDVVELIPFVEGEVKPGSIAKATFSGSSGWEVEKWTCREFRFRPPV